MKGINLGDVRNLDKNPELKGFFDSFLQTKLDENRGVDEDEVSEYLNTDPEFRKALKNIRKGALYFNEVIDFFKAESSNQFNLDYPKLVAAYPEMEQLGTTPERPDEIHTISQIFTNGNTIDAYIQQVINNEPTGDIEYLLKMVGEGLLELSEMENPIYENFYKKEAGKHVTRISRAEQAIGDKKRNMENHGIYE